mmetsp:Transcript_26289/g.30753  ORF Transcript_26289/g.30753 Transcript_26289/m.30753 type:complete len:107 (+) Transcript_26289:1242-1562(+)
MYARSLYKLAPSVCCFLCLYPTPSFILRAYPCSIASPLGSLLLLLLLLLRVDHLYVRVRYVAVARFAVRATLRVDETLVELATPLVLHQEVPLQDRLDHEVVLLVA